MRLGRAATLGGMKPETCPDCCVDAGAPHLDGCDVARCAVTGEQRLLSCGESGGHAEGTCGYEPGTDCRTVWTGERPGKAECRQLGWYARFIPGAGFARCSADAPEATEDLTRLKVETVWDRATQGRVLRS